MKSALPLAIVALTAGATIITALPASRVASAATNCLPSPKGAAPEGSHWYYRTDRAAQRKCWYLASEDRDAAKETARTASQSKPAAPKVKAATPDDSTAPPLQDARALVTKDVSDTKDSDVAPDDALVILPPPAMIEQQPAVASAPVQQAQATNDAQVIAVDTQAAEPPAAQQPIVPVNSVTDSPAPTSTRVLQFVFLALAVFGLLGGAFLYIAEIRRRRTSVLSAAPHPHTSERKVRVTVDGPAVPPSPARSTIEQHDDTEQALERLAQLRRRQAA